MNNETDFELQYLGERKLTLSRKNRDFFRKFQETLDFRDVNYHSQNKSENPMTNRTFFAI